MYVHMYELGIVGLRDVELAQADRNLGATSAPSRCHLGAAMPSDVRAPPGQAWLSDLTRIGYKFPSFGRGAVGV